MTIVVFRMEVGLQRRFSTCSTEEMKIASKKAVPKNTTTVVNWVLRVSLNWVTHSKEVEGRSYTAQNLWHHARSEDHKCLNIMNAKDERFTQLHTIVDNLSRNLHNQGVGASKIWARVITDVLLHLSCSRSIPYSGNLSKGEKFHEFCSFGAISKSFNHKNFHWVRRRHYQCMGVSLSSTFGDSVGIMNVASLSLCKAVFVQQQLPKPRRGHGSLDQQSPFCSFLAYSSHSRQFNLFRHFLPMHFCRFTQFVKVLIAKIRCTNNIEGGVGLC